MTPQQRLRLWYVAAIALVITPHAWFEIPTALPILGKGFTALLFLILAPGLITLFVLLIVLLLWTTPSNAIRLKPRRSFILLSLLTALLYFHAMFRFDSGSDAWLAVGFTILAAIFFTEAAVHKRRSPWWVVPLWWNPLMVGPFALSNTAVIVLAGVILAVMIVLPREAELTA